VDKAAIDYVADNSLVVSLSLSHLMGNQSLISDLTAKIVERNKAKAAPKFIETV